jgi:hypothetical protein
MISEPFRIVWFIYCCFSDDLERHLISFIMIIMDWLELDEGKSKRGELFKMWYELGLIWKALQDACLCLPEEDDQLSFGITARLPHIPSQQDSMKVELNPAGN